MHLHGFGDTKTMLLAFREFGVAQMKSLFRGHLEMPGASGLSQRLGTQRGLGPGVLNVHNKWDSS